MCNEMRKAQYAHENPSGYQMKLPKKSNKAKLQKLHNTQGNRKRKGPIPYMYCDLTKCGAHKSGKHTFFGRKEQQRTHKKLESTKRAPEKRANSNFSRHIEAIEVNVV